MLRVGDGEAGDAAGVERFADGVHAAGGAQRRAGRGEERDAPDGVKLAPVARVPALRQAEDERLIGRQEQLDGTALLDLARDVAGGAEGEADGLAGLGLEPPRDLLQGEL